MYDINRVQLLGRLTSSPELKETTTKTLVTSFCIATNKKHPKTGEEQVEFHNLVAFGTYAQQVCSMKKGDKIFVEGSLQTRSWASQDGKKNYKTEVIATTIATLPPFTPIGQKEEVSIEDMPF